MIRLFFMMLFCFSTAWAQENTTRGSVQATAPKWKAEFTSYFYDFQGERSQRNNLYGFANSNLQMQLFVLSYQLNPQWTLMAIGQHLNNYVETEASGMTFKDRTQGMGDTILSAMTPVTLGSSLMVFADLGISLPTGSINIRNASSDAANYPYNMQNGSGTVDTIAGVTALYIQPVAQVGGRFAATIRNGKSANDYGLGNQYKLDAWVDGPTKWNLTPRVVGYYKHKNAIRGVDPRIGRNAFTEFYHHDQVNWDLSAALRGAVQVGGVKLTAEMGLPFAQDSSNIDDVAVFTQAYGSLGVSGSF